MRHTLLIPLLLLAAGPAFAGSFQVSPVRVELTPAAPTAAITVQNGSATEDVVVQLRAVNWSQDKGEDVYTPSTDLIATPPIFTLKPSASQTVRVGLRRAEQRDTQQTFRLYITEVPPPPKQGFQGLQVALNVGIPIFIAPKVRSGGEPTWAGKADGAGSYVVSGTNPANAHLQVYEVKLFDQQGTEPLATLEQPKYILARQTVAWKLAVKRMPQGKVRLVARTDAGNIEADVASEPAATR